MESTQETIHQNDIYKTSRFLYILEAAFEYFISLLLTGAYIAKVTTEIGMNDSLTGIVTSFVSLGCGFQFIAIFLSHKKPVKRWVSLLHSLNQLFFALVYFVPFFKTSTEAKTALFIVFLLVGYFIDNIVKSPKINWFMSLVDDKKRGSFTATKEIVSLIGGMIFSFIVSTAIDAFEAAGNLHGAFLFCGIGILVLMAAHTCTMIFSKEKPAKKTEKESLKEVIKGLVKEKNLFKVVFLFVLWDIAYYATTPFYGTYQIKELGFSMTYVSVLAALYAIIRAIFSKPLGRYADKHSFSKTLIICFSIQTAAFFINIFTTPANGYVFYTAYYILSAIAMGGISSSTINLIYDNVSIKNRTGALALKNTLAGCMGFLSTLAMGPLVEYIQTNGNTFLGIPVYAQQVLSAFGCLVMVGMLLYLILVVDKLKKNEE